MKHIMLTLAILAASASAKAVEYHLITAGKKVNITGMQLLVSIPIRPVRFA